MLADLHTHSRRSDGTDSPEQLVRRAAERGIDVLALTDHDSAAGWAEAQRAADEVGVAVVSGIEVSCRHRGAGVHLLAYLPDPGFPPLVAELSRVLEGRAARLPATVLALQHAGVAIGVDDVHRVSGDAVATGRPHVADALVALGVVRDRTQAFDRWLSPGRAGYVDRYAADLRSMIALVTAAGGVSVVAHPWARSSARVLDAAELAGLRDAGLAGVEADHHDHSRAQRVGLHGLASDLGLVATGASDYHGRGKVDHELGSCSTSPGQLDRLLELAAMARERAGRGTPAPSLA